MPKKQSRAPGGGRKPKNPEGNRTPFTGRLDPESHQILQDHAREGLSQAEIVDQALLLWVKKQEKNEKKTL